MNKLETVILENGLTLYLYPDKRRHSTFFQFNTFCGGTTKHFLCDGVEYSLPDGVAHILEHYIVECNQKGNFLTELGEMQMSTNASTSFYVTNYYFEAVEEVLFGIRTILEGVYHVSFEPEKLEKLKNPIYQEIRGKFDNKFYHAGRKRMENLFPNLDFRDVGGTLEEVESVTIEDLKILYDAFYQPKNQFIVIAGNFNSDDVLKEIKEFYQNLKLEEHETTLIPYHGDLSLLKEKDSFSFPSPMDYTEISFKIDVSKYSSEELLDYDFYLNSFYSSSFGPASPLYKRLVDEKIIIDSIHCSDFTMNHFLVITIGAYTNNVEVFQKCVLEEVNSLENLDSEIFEMDKNSSIVQLILRGENIFKMIFPFINNIVYFDYPYMDKVEDVQKLSYEEYVSKIKELDFSHYTCLTIEKE